MIQFFLIACFVLVSGCSANKSFNEISEAPDNKIIGGSKVDFSDPLKNHAVFLQVGYYKNSELIQSGDCTGIVIGTKSILTAAHCFGNKSGSFDSVTVAVAFGLEIKNPESLTVVLTDKFIIHPKYSDKVENSRQYDLAIVSIDKAVPFPFKPITISRDINELRVSDSLTVLGYGISDQILNKNDLVLRKVSLNITALADNGIYVSEDFFKSTCKGDSGGPAIYNSPSGIKLIGVVVAGWGPEGYKCGASAYFARVDINYDFINPYIQ